MTRLPTSRLSVSSVSLRDMRTFKADTCTLGIPAQLDLSAGESQVKFFSPPPEGKTRVALLVCLEHPLSRGTGISANRFRAEPCLLTNVALQSTLQVRIPRPILASIQATSETKSMRRSSPRPSNGSTSLLPRSSRNTNRWAGWTKWRPINTWPSLSVSLHHGNSAILADSMLGDRVLPPKDVDITSEEARINVVENHIATQYHICGSCESYDLPHSLWCSCCRS